MLANMHISCIHWRSQGRTSLCMRQGMPLFIFYSHLATIWHLFSARLTYFLMDNKLIMAMPYDVHEEPFNKLQAELWNTICLIPLNFDNGRNEVAVQLYTDMRVEGQMIFAYSDVYIQVCSMSNHPHLSQLQPYFFLKCAFSQTASDVDWKLRA